MKGHTTVGMAKSEDRKSLAVNEICELRADDLCIGFGGRWCGFAGVGPRHGCEFDAMDGVASGFEETCGRGEGGRGVPRARDEEDLRFGGGRRHDGLPIRVE